MEKEKIVFKGTHPDSLYRVPTESVTGGNRVIRVLRLLRWPLALITVCIALAVFVYFLMPSSIDADRDTKNGTYWESNMSDAQKRRTQSPVMTAAAGLPKLSSNKPERSRTKQGTKTPEIDFYSPVAVQTTENILATKKQSEVTTNNKLPVSPVFPEKVIPEIQYGNEKADVEKGRSINVSDYKNGVSIDSTLVPHITQKPEKPLAIYFKDGKEVMLSNGNYEDAVIANFDSRKESTTKAAFTTRQSTLSSRKIQKEPIYPYLRAEVIKPSTFDDRPPEIEEFYARQPVQADVRFTSGHSKIFGLSIEDADKIKSTTQNSIYNTKVSPTLPTWRDVGETTTTNYPVNINSDVNCRSTRISICRGVLPYDLAGPAASIGKVEVTTYLPQFEYLMATNCSDRLRQFVCSMLEPECIPSPNQPKMPCYNLCKAISDGCESLVPRELLPIINCNQFPNTNCVGARSPCYASEMQCGDGTCIPKDWICDGTKDCIRGEDEASCERCDKNEYRCATGGCIQKRWLCDGYTDCPEGEDESDSLCAEKPQHARGVEEQGEEVSGSAPAPSVRRLNLPYREAESDSKELLMTSDSNNALKRNYNRRPLPSRLTPYKSPVSDEIPTTEADIEIEKVFPKPMKSTIQQSNETNQSLPASRKTIPSRKIPEQIKQRNQVDVANRKAPPARKFKPEKTTVKYTSNKTEDSTEMENGDAITNTVKDEKNMSTSKKPAVTKSPKTPLSRRTTIAPRTTPAVLNSRRNQIDQIIDGVKLMTKAAEAEYVNLDEEKDQNMTASLEKYDDFPGGPSSSHTSPCPAGELRCVEGRCITLAQLCDGTVDCSDNADEDNCFT